MRIPEDDLEQQMEALRHFKLAHGLRVAASEIAGTLPLMKVSDYLTWLAEAILVEVLGQPGGSWCSVMAGRCAPTARRAIRTSSSSATARSAGWSSAMARTSTWCSSMTATPVRDRWRQIHRWRAVLYPPGAEDHPFPHRADAIRHPLRGRHASASERRGRPAGEFAGRLPALPGAGGLDLGAPGVGPRPGAGRLPAGQRRASRRYVPRCWRGRAISTRCAPKSAKCAPRCATTWEPARPPPVPPRMPSRPRQPSISSTMPVVSSISNLWCNMRF